MGRKSEGFKLRTFEWSQGVYYITWSVGGKTHRRSTGQTDRDEAEKVRASLVLQSRQRNNTQSLTVEQALDDYMREHSDHIPSKDVTRFNAVHLKAFFGGMQVSEVTPSKVKEYIREKRDEKYADGTIRKQLTPLSAAFNHARKEGRIFSHAIITMPNPTTSKTKTLNQAEAKSLLDVCTENYLRLFVAMGIYTGARKSAILDLKWSQVNLKDRMINFNPPGRAQTKKHRPIVPIGKELLEMLKEARNINKGQYVVMFRGDRLWDIKKGFKEACNRAKLKNVTPHTLRHTFATWLAQAGVDMWRIAKLLGDTIRTIEKNYAHHAPEYMHEDVDVISIKLQAITGRNRRKPLKLTRKQKQYA